MKLTAICSPLLLVSFLACQTTVLCFNLSSCLIYYFIPYQLITQADILSFDLLLVVQNVLNEHLTPYETSVDMPAGIDVQTLAEGFDKKIEVIADPLSINNLAFGSILEVYGIILGTWLSTMFH